MFFNGTNYRDWISRMCLHMRELHLWEFLTGVLPCSPPPWAPQPVISEKTTTAEKERLIVDYDDCLASYESQFHAYRTWLDEDVGAGSSVTASMKDRFTADIVEFARSHQMWTFLLIRYEPIGQSTFLAAIRQEQLLRQGDDTVDAGLLRVSSILAARSLVASSAARGAITGLHCDHCG
jgi:hypothetical protein